MTTVNIWQPPAKKADIAPQDLHKIIAIAKSDDADTLTAALTPQLQPIGKALSQATEKQWSELTAFCSAQDLFGLIRLYTIAEMRFTGWRMGDQSPVIILTRLLQQRGVSPPKELLHWIKKHSDNRYLPFGPLV